MEKLLLTFFSIIVYAIILRIWIYCTRNHRFIFLFTWSAFITIFSLFLSNYIPLSFVTEKDLIRSFTRSENRYHDLVDSVDHRFTLIDVSGAKMLNQDPIIPVKSNVITNRTKLVEFLSFLRKHDTLFSMIVLDITFEDQSKADSALHHELKQIANLKNKQLLLASAGSQQTEENKLIYKDLEGSMADVTDYPDEDNFFKHSLIKNEEHSSGSSLKSLPYLLYNHITDTKMKSASFFNIALEQKNEAYFPSFIFTNFVPPIYKDATESTYTHDFLEKIHLVSEEETHVEMDTSQDFNLNYLVDLTDDLDTSTKLSSLDNLRMRMHQRMTDGHKNIVFIGDFDSDQGEDDMHSTAVGPVQGSKIMLNIYYHLITNHHKNVALKFLLLFCLILIVSYPVVYKGQKSSIWRVAFLNRIKLFIITCIQRIKSYLNRKSTSIWDFAKKGLKLKMIQQVLNLVRSVGKLNKFQFVNKLKFIQDIKLFKMGTTKHYLHKVYDFIFFDERHYWVLVIVLYIFYSITGFIICIIPLFGFFFILSTDLNSFQNKKLKKKYILNADN